MISKDIDIVKLYSPGHGSAIGDVVHLVPAEYGPIAIA